MILGESENEISIKRSQRSANIMKPEEDGKFENKRISDNTLKILQHRNIV